MQSPATGGVRFAPSPTGNFHVGNLRTAWISFQIAKALHLPWIVRFEDIDRPRIVYSAREQQSFDLKKLGLIPDFVFLQSEFRNHHWAVFLEAVKSKQIYACDCSRKEVQAALSSIASAPHSSLPTYSGRCRQNENKLLQPSETLAWRFKMPDESGKDDFIVARTSDQFANGLPLEKSFTPSYHWACAIDDHDGNYDLLVRSSDLRNSLALQRAIQKWLGRNEMIPVFHTSLITQNDGHRLEKRTSGVTLDEILKSGKSVADVCSLFEISFDLNSAITLSKDVGFGEKEETLTLQRLGFS